MGQPKHLMMRIIVLFLIDYTIATTVTKTTHTTAAPTTAQPSCISRNETVYLKDGRKTADVKLEHGDFITLPVGDYGYTTKDGCVRHISIGVLGKQY